MIHTDGARTVAHYPATPRERAEERNRITRLRLEEQLGPNWYARLERLEDELDGYADGAK